MKAAIHSPYLDTFGGGEKYMMTIAEVLSKNGFSVDVLLDKHLFHIGSNYLRDELSKRFNLNLNEVNFINGPVGKGSSFLLRLPYFKKYDVLFYLTDGSIFYPSAKRNILHIQSPIIGQPAKSIWGKLKLKGWDLIIYNSNFTRKNSENNWPIKSEVIYPPVDVDKIRPLEKKRYILSVGRFFGYLKDKKHEVMIQAFKDLYATHNITGWSLNLVGSAQSGDEIYLKQLRNLAKDLPVNFYPNLEYDKLIKLYGQSSIYWHAAGYGEDDPTKMEHFGISTVEAMAGGCVPVVIGKGGQPEIVEPGRSGFLWNNMKALEEYSLMLIQNEELMVKMAKKACLRAKYFSKEKFKQNIFEICKI